MQMKTPKQRSTFNFLARVEFTPSSHEGFLPFSQSAYKHNFT